MVSFPLFLTLSERAYHRQRSGLRRAGQLTFSTPELLTRNAELWLHFILHLEHFHLLQDKNRTLFVLISALIVLLAPISVCT